MRLVVGLGNPGAEYAQHRHNIGFMAADEIVRRHSFGPWRSRFQGQVAEGTVAGVKTLALKPMTYMNESGQSVGAALRFFKLELDQLIVLHDELDLAPGKVKVKRGGGAAGHNGLRSLDAHLGADYLRVRLGIGHPGDRDRVHGYVLSDFAKADKLWLDPLIAALADNIGLLIGGDEANFMNRVAMAVKPPRPKEPKPESDTSNGL